MRRTTRDTHTNKATSQRVLYVYTHTLYTQRRARNAIY